MDTDAVASQIAQRLSDLKSYLAPLVANWSGEESAEYQALQARWDAWCERFEPGPASDGASA